MFHSIPTEKFGALGPPMANAVHACVHCGFCLAACPTYHELGQEMDTPRGRIVLMKEVLEGKLEWAAAQPHVDRCLGCLACEPACPSGVPYRDLISPFRALAQERVPRSAGAKLRHWMAAQTIPYPARFRAAVYAGRLARPFRPMFPQALRPMLELIPKSIPWKERWPEVTPAQGERRARVALLAGCAQSVLEPDINTATIEMLSREGVEVVVPRRQGCCGGLAWHAGDLGAAQDFARANLKAFPEDVDAVVTNAAGCGSAMQEYHLILRGTPEEARAAKFHRRVVDASVFLKRLGLREGGPPLTPTLSPRRGEGEGGAGSSERLRIAYHDACHLAHAQGVRAEPRALLRAIPGVELIELADAQFCCGSAGTYNLDQPELASKLGEQKAKAVIETGADIVATGNIGCLTQLRAHLDRLGSKIRVRHTMQVLRDAYVGKGVNAK